jgi:hypothetical protein
MCSYVNVYNGSLLSTHVQQNIKVFRMVHYTFKSKYESHVTKYKNLSPKSTMQITQIQCKCFDINIKKK